MTGVPLGPDPHDHQAINWEERYRQLDRETAAVEKIIVMRTGFGQKSLQGAPYVGWPGLARALEEELDERDRLREDHAALELLYAEATTGAAQVNADLARAVEAEKKLHQIRMALGEDCADDPAEVVLAWRRIVRAAQDLAAVLNEQDGLATIAPTMAAPDYRQAQTELHTRYHEARQLLQAAVAAAEGRCS